jgi:hypothetical protein
MGVNVKELRIGNWIELNGASCEISGISQTGEIFINTGKIRCSDCEPIRLTEEIIKKCGFQRSEERNYYKLYEDFIGLKFMLSSENILIYIIQYRERTNEVIPMSNCQPLKHILYLHQLQNLHYDIIGRELENLNFMKDEHKNTFKTLLG